MQMNFRKVRYTLSFIYLEKAFTNAHIWRCRFICGHCHTYAMFDVSFFFKKKLAIASWFIIIRLHSFYSLSVVSYACPFCCISSFHTHL
jgi:hypothetical protein